MTLTKEQIFFLAVLAVLGWMSYTRIANPYTASARPAGKKLEVPDLRPVPMPVHAPADDDLLKKRGRDIFAQPREWVALDPLELEPPPITPPPFVPPFPTPALGVPFWMRYARSEPVIATDLHVLGAAADQPPAEPAADAPDAAKPEKPEKVDKPAASAKPTAAPKGDAGSAAPDKPPAAEDRARDYPKRFDQLQFKDSPLPVFGLIRNKDKWNLADRPGEAIQWQLLGSKGELMSGVAPIDRARVESFKFADTPLNNFYVEKRELKQRTDNPVKRLEFIDRWLELARAEPALHPALQSECEEVLAAPSTAQVLAARQGKIFEMLGETFARQYDFEGELKSYRRGLDLGLDYSGLHRAYACYLERYGLHDEADAAFQKALRADVNDAVAARDYGVFLLHRGRAEEARQQFENATKPSGITTELRVSALCGLAAAQLMLGNVDEANAQAQRAQGLLPADANVKAFGGLDPFTVLGAVASARGDDAKARSYFDTAVERAPTATALTHQAIALTRASDLMAAYQKLQQAIDLDPLSAPAALRARGAVEERAGLLDAAIETYQAALDRDPDDAYGMYLLGRAQRRSGDLERAEQLMGQSLKRDGRFVAVLNEQGTLALQLDRATDAERFFKESLLRDPGRAEVDYLLGLAYLRGGQVPAAREAFKQALAARDKWAAPKNGLAFCAYKDGATDESLQLLRQVVDQLAGDAAQQDAVYADQYRKAIGDNLAKEQWIDTFAWKTMGNGWDPSERHGVLIRPLGNALSFNGTQKDNGAITELWRPFKNGAQLVSYEAELVAAEGNQGLHGIALIKEQVVQGEQVPYHEIALARDQNGGIQYLVREANHDKVAMGPLKDNGQEVKVDPHEPVRLAIVRVPDKKGLFELRVNDQPRGDAIEIAPLGATGNIEFRITIFCMAGDGHNVDVSASRARLVRKRS
ncbi:MAG: tetratricopeptide repeat protein [Planctomycetota bacterium]